MATSVEMVFADVADREVELTAGRHLDAVGILAHKDRIDYSSDSQRLVDQPFGVTLLIVEFCKILLRQSDQHTAVALEDLHSFEDRETIEFQRIIGTGFDRLIYDLLLVGSFFEKLHHDLIDLGVVAVHREILRVGDQTGEDAGGAGSVEFEYNPQAAISLNTSSHVDDISG